MVSKPPVGFFLPSKLNVVRKNYPLGVFLLAFCGMFSNIFPFTITVLEESS